MRQEPIIENGGPRVLTAVLFGSLGLVMLASLLLAIPFERVFPPASVIPEQSTLVFYPTAVRQRIAHVFWIVALAAICLFALFGPWKAVDHFTGGGALDRIAVPGRLLVVVVLLGIFWSRWLHDYGAAYALAAAIITAPLPWIGASRPFTGRFIPLMERYAGLFVLAYLAVTLASGFFGHGNFKASVYVNTIDYHLSVVLGSVEVLRKYLLSAADPFPVISLNYGFLSTFSAAGLGATFNVETVGSYVRLIQIYQLIFALIFVASSWLWSQGNRLFLLFACITVLPWVSTVHASVMAPNQSGYRMLVFAALPAVILLLQHIKTNRARIAVSAVAAAVMCAWNFETGIAATAAIALTGLLIPYRQGKRLPQLLGIAALLVAGMTVSLLAILAIVLPGELFLATTFNHFVRIVGTGFNGLAHHTDMLPLAIAVLLSAVLIHTCIEARRGRLDDGLLARGAMAGAAAVWMAYYALRPDSWNLWGVICLCVFVVEPITRAEFWSRRDDTAGGRVPAPLAAAAALALLVPSLQAHEFLFRYRAVSFQGTPSFQGLVLPATLVEQVSRQAGALSAASGTTVYATPTPFIMALASGKTNDLPIFDLFGETWTEAEFRQLQLRIININPDQVMIDPEGSPSLALSIARRMFYNRLRERLPNDFVEVGEAGGWNVWRPVPNQR